MTNSDRAVAARRALATFTIQVYGNRTPEDLGAPTVDDGVDGERVEPDTDAETMVADLICDLGHYCRAVGLDYQEQLDRAAMHYHEEEPLGWDEE
jgi:hypothetical protein